MALVIKRLAAFFFVESCCAKSSSLISPELQNLSLVTSFVYKTMKVIPVPYKRLDSTEHVGGDDPPVSSREHFLKPLLTLAFVLENLLLFELELYLEFSLNIQLQQINLG